MNSSYLKKLDYGDVFRTILFMHRPKKIVEIGILEGYSLDIFSSCTDGCDIKAYDIFEEFDGNGARRDDLVKKFGDRENVTIEYGDFYKLHDTIDDASLDILHIDIANNGDVYRYAFENYMSKVKKDGLLILEGGSNERDNVEWMEKYAKPKIALALDDYRDSYDILTIGGVPSVTLVRRL